MTLEDAFQGLLRYWRMRPDGGNRAELISAAIAQGFEEPLLNEWLDVFLQGFVDTAGMGMTVPDYDRELAPLIAKFGFAVAERSATAVFEHLIDSGRELDVIRKENSLVKSTATLEQMNAALLVIDQGITLASTLQDGDPKIALISAATAGRDQERRKRDAMARLVSELTEELAAGV